MVRFLFGYGFEKVLFHRVLFKTFTGNEKKLFEWWLLISPLNLKAKPAGGTTNNYGNECIFLGNDLGLVPSKEYKAGNILYVITWGLRSSSAHSCGSKGTHKHGGKSKCLSKTLIAGSDDQSVVTQIKISKYVQKHSLERLMLME